jgi:hypothetical protein
MTRISKVLQVNYRHQAVSHDNNLPSTSQNLSQSPERAMVLQHPNLHDQQIRVISQTPICTNFLFQISCPAPHDSRRIPEAKPRGIPGMEQRSQERTPAALTKSKPEPAPTRRARAHERKQPRKARSGWRDHGGEPPRPSHPAARRATKQQRRHLKQRRNVRLEEGAE